MPPSTNVCSLQSLRVSQHQIPAFRGLPNTSVQRKPLLIYHSAFQNAGASEIENHLNSVGVVSPQWRYTMYTKCCFGGEENPERFEPVLEKGDVVVVPAGVGHCLLEDYGGFQMVGSYPVGKTWDMCYGRKGEEEKARRIASLAWFDRDPIYGEQGPTLDV